MPAFSIMKEQQADMAITRVSLLISAFTVFIIQVLRTDRYDGYGTVFFFPGAKRDL